MKAMKAAAKAGSLSTVVNSAQHPPEYYLAMRADFERNGHWRGELWQRRKDGEGQMQLFADPAKELLATLARTDLESLSPLQAFELMREWKAKFAGK